MKLSMKGNSLKVSEEISIKTSGEFDQQVMTAEM